MYYPDDLEMALGNELIQLYAFARETQAFDKHCQSLAMFLYNLIIENNIKCTFVNAETALRIYLTIMVSNASSERSFSKMKYVKNRLRTSMLNEKFSHLTLLSIESEIMKEIDFNVVIDDFARKKSRKSVLKCVNC